MEGDVACRVPDQVRHGFPVDVEDLNMPTAVLVGPSSLADLPDVDLGDPDQRQAATGGW